MKRGEKSVVSPATMPMFTTGHQIQDDLNVAPNPKPTAQDKASFGRLANLYTAFSVDFATHALDLCLRAGCQSIADPFSGMGTLAQAGRTRSVQLQLSDISPFAVLSSAFRAARSADIERSLSLLNSLASRAAAKDEKTFFSTVLDAIEHESGRSMVSIISTPSQPKHTVAALAVYVAALSRIRLHGRLVGSNPTWVKRTSTSADASATFHAVQATINTTREFASGLPNLHPRNRTRSTWASIENNSVVAGSLDAIVTSPPYANRTDYIRHYLPASELLMLATGTEERQLRADQIGTPLIRCRTSSRPLPASIADILEKIRTHPSYASERYYFKGFSYYFNDMYDALTQMRSWLRDDGLLLMVVQDSYYKDLLVPTTNLLQDLAESIGFRSAGRRDWPVRNYLSQLSPHSRRFMPNRRLSESVLAFSR